MGVLIDILAAGVVDSSGAPLSSGVVYVYQVGTTTKVAVYADVDLTDPVANPVTLDAAGKVEIYTETAVRLVIQDSQGGSVDDIGSVGTPSSEATLNADLIPDVSGANDIGSAEKRVAEVHTNDLYVYDEAFIETITRVGVNNPGWINNLSIEIQSGVFRIVGADGTALSTDNPGYVVCPSTTPGRPKLLKVTSGGSFNDDTHASSSLTNLGFGITETVNWSEAVPFFVYVVNSGNTNVDGADGSSTFFISRSPSKHTTPSLAANIGDNGGIPVNDTKDVILLMDDVTVASYVSLPCQLIGAFQMVWSTATDDWTVQSFSNSDGLGETQLTKTFSKTWVMPLNQNSATTGSYLLTNGGTVPIFTTNSYLYMIRPDGMCLIDFFVDGDGGTDGSGAVALLMSIPYTVESPTNQRVFGSARVENPTYDVLAFARNSTDGASISFIRATLSGSNLQNDLGVVDHGNFTAGARSIAGTALYRAFA